MSIDYRIRKLLEQRPVEGVPMHELYKALEDVPESVVRMRIGYLRTYGFAKLVGNGTDDRLLLYDDPAKREALVAKQKAGRARNRVEPTPAAPASPRAVIALARAEDGFDCAVWLDGRVVLRGVEVNPETGEVTIRPAHARRMFQHLALVIDESAGE